MLLSSIVYGRISTICIAMNTNINFHCLIFRLGSCKWRSLIYACQDMKYILQFLDYIYQDFLRMGRKVAGDLVFSTDSFSCCNRNTTCTQYGQNMVQSWENILLKVKVKILVNWKVKVIYQKKAATETQPAHNMVRTWSNPGDNILLKVTMM